MTAWSQLIDGVDPETGDKMKIWVVDTEGIGSTDADLNHDTKIFSLAALLASSFWVNYKGPVDETALNHVKHASFTNKHKRCTTL